MIRQKWVKLFSLALTVSFLLLNAINVQGQTLYGTIQGQVQDQQGAAIGKAEITVRNLENGAVRKVNANDAGAYQVTSIPPGSYEVTASIAGFRTDVRSGITVTVGAEINVNFSLTVGAVSEKIEVTAEAAQVDTSSATMGGFVNSTTIRELSLNGRDWISLSLLQPGAASLPRRSRSRDSASFTTSRELERYCESLMFETPFNENLVLSSSTGLEGLAQAVFGSVGVAIQPGFRNHFNAPAIFTFSDSPQS